MLNNFDFIADTPTSSDVLELDVARFVGYALRSLTDHRPTALEIMGLIQRKITNDKSDYLYQSTVRKYVAEQFPDLDEDVMVERICKLEKV